MLIRALLAIVLMLAPSYGQTIGGAATGGLPLDTFDQNHTSVGIALSGGNLTATGAPSGTACTDDNCLNSRSVSSHVAGKWYDEIIVNHVTVSASIPGVGLSNGYAIPGQFLGGSINSIGYYSDGGVCNPSNNCNGLYATIAPFTDGAVIGQAVDLDHHKIWFTLNGTTWNNDVLANQNPVTNTGGFDISMIAGLVYVAVEVNGTGDSFTAKFRAPFTYTVPAGYRGGW